MITWLLDPIDPMVARDGRPFGFGAGNIMRCMDWISPSVTTGTVRTLLGKTLADTDPFHDPVVLGKLRRVNVKGPFPFAPAKHSLFFPAPRDLIIAEREGNRQVVALHPAGLQEGEGMDIPSGLQPIDIQADEKPLPAPAFWSASQVANWLSGPPEPAFSVPEKGDGQNFLDAFPKDQRTHLKVDPSSGTAEESMLFISEGLVFPPGLSIILGIDAQDTELRKNASEIRRAHGLGGDHRQALFSVNLAIDPWDCPEQVKGSLRGASHIRMMLATPGIFAGGWRPGWVDAVTLEGIPPEIPAAAGLRLKLVAGIIDHWQPVSGWSLERSPQSGQPGPKGLRRVVPAGGVYFFQVLAGDPQGLCSLWLESVCDEPQDRLDGFGLALWGRGECD